MTFSQVCYFNHYVVIHQVKILVFDNYQTGPVPLSQGVYIEWETIINLKTLRIIKYLEPRRLDGTINLCT